MIPTHFHTQSRAFTDIIKLAEKHPNDMDLGKLVRTLIQNYKDGNYNPPSNIQLDKPRFADDYIQ